MDPKLPDFTVFSTEQLIDVLKKTSAILANRQGHPRLIEHFDRLGSALRPTPTSPFMKDRVLTVVESVASKYDIPMGVVLGDSRTATASRARHECWYLLRRDTNWSYPQIAKFFNRDHTTIIEGVRQHKKRNEIQD